MWLTHHKTEGFLSHTGCVHCMCVCVRACAYAFIWRVKQAVFLWPFHTHSHKYSYCSHRSHLVLLNSRCKIVTFRSHLHRIHECKQKAPAATEKWSVKRQYRAIKEKWSGKQAKYVDLLLWKQTMDFPRKKYVER